MGWSVEPGFRTRPSGFGTEELKECADARGWRGGPDAGAGTWNTEHGDGDEHVKMCR